MPQKRNADRDGLYQRVDSPYWWGSFTDASGRRIRRSTGKTDRVEAKRVLAEWFTREGQPSDGRPQIYSFDELMLAYMEAGRTIKDRRKTASSLARDEGCIAVLYDAFTGYKLLPTGVNAEELDGPFIDGKAVFSYVEARRKGEVLDSTIRRELCVLGAAITYANSRWGWGLIDPTRHRKPSQGEGRVRWITPEEANRLMDVARKEPRAPHLADWIQTALHTGCRKGELLGLEWARVDLRRNVIYLESQHNKSRRRQSVPLNQMAREALLSRASFRAKHCPATPWVFTDKAGNRLKDVKKAFATACRNAGIADFHPHDLRHTCASWLVMARVPLPTVKEVLRHSSIMVTERYAHLAPEQARDALAVLEETAVADKGALELLDQAYRHVSVTLATK